MYKVIYHSKPFVDDADALVVADVVKSGIHAAGAKAKEFEERLAGFIGVKYARAVNSGTSALHLALLSLNIRGGDEVIIPGYVCASVLNAVNYTGAKAVLADIDSEFDKKGYNISARTIKSLITSRTRAIIVPHMFGFPAEIDEIISLGVPVIEDCAHSIGGSYKGKMLGSFGKISIFSFYATKMLSTGYGGMIVSPDEKIFRRIEDLTKYDGRDKYDISYNYSFSDIQAALGIKQLEKLGKFIERRRAIEEKYNAVFRDRLIISAKSEESFAFRYIVRFKNKEERDKIKDKLLERGIRTELPIFKPLHRYFSFDKDEFKNTEEAFETSLSLPCYPALTDEEIDYVIGNVLDVLG